MTALSTRGKGPIIIRENKIKVNLIPITVAGIRFGIG